jgi:hypothetical protein
MQIEERIADTHHCQALICWGKKENKKKKTGGADPYVQKQQQL